MRFVSIVKNGRRYDLPLDQIAKGEPIKSDSPVISRGAIVSLKGHKGKVLDTTGELASVSWEDASISQVKISELKYEGRVEKSDRYDEGGVGSGRYPKGSGTKDREQNSIKGGFENPKSLRYRGHEIIVGKYGEGMSGKGKYSYAYAHKDAKDYNYPDNWWSSKSAAIGHAIRAINSDLKDMGRVEKMTKGGPGSGIYERHPKVDKVPEHNKSLKEMHDKLNEAEASRLVKPRGGDETQPDGSIMQRQLNGSYVHIPEKYVWTQEKEYSDKKKYPKE